MQKSNAYDPTQAMGGIEHVWGVCTPDARCMLAAAQMGKRHWYSAYRLAVFLSCIQIQLRARAAFRAKLRARRAAGRQSGMNNTP